MANELVYREATGKTVTVDIDNAAGVVGAGVAAAESAGLYRATMPTAAPGVYWLRWNNTTDATVHREWIYWDGVAISLPIPLTAQQTRDAVDLPHTDLTAGMGTFFKAMQALVSRR